MLDIHVLREDSARIAQNLRDRHARVFEDLAPGAAADPAGADWAAQTVARLVDLDSAYLGLLRRQDELRQQQNQTSAAMKSRICASNPATKAAGNARCNAASISLALCQRLLASFSSAFISTPSSVRE